MIMIKITMIIVSIIMIIIIIIIIKNTNFTNTIRYKVVDIVWWLTALSPLFWLKGYVL